MTTAINPSSVISLPRVRKAQSAVNQLPIFYEDWRDGFLDESKWVKSITSSGSITVGVGATNGLFGRCRMETGATNGGVASIASRKPIFLPIFGQTALTTFKERCVIEIEMIVGGGATVIDNTTFFFGICAGQQNVVRISNGNFGFGTTSDVLEGYTITGGTAATKTLTNSITLTALHTYRLEIDRVNGERWYVDNVLEVSHTTAASIPSNIGPAYVNIYLKNDSAAAATIDFGAIRVWLEDII